MSWEKLGKVETAGILGAATGYGVVSYSGLTAAGMMGKNFGVGCSAGLVGAGAGAALGVSLYALGGAIMDLFETPKETPFERCLREMRRTY